MKKLTLLLLIALTSFAAFANDVDKHEAYILLNKDTVYGYVLTNDLESVYLKFDFEGPDGKVTSYTPGEIKRFGINVLDVWRKYVVLDLGAPTGPKAVGSTLVFAQALEETGTVRLYKYECYVQGKGKFVGVDLNVVGDRILLAENCLIKNDEILRLSRTSLIGNTKKELRRFFVDCPTVIASVNSSKKIMENLQGFVRQYNRCHEKKASPSKPS